MTVAQEILEQIADRIMKLAHPDRVILFGSAATGEMTADSDPDLLVIERQVTHTRQESVRLRAALEDVPFPIEVIVMSRQWFDDTQDVIGGIACPAHNYGRVLYDAA